MNPFLKWPLTKTARKVYRQEIDKLQVYLGELQ